MLKLLCLLVAAALLPLPGIAETLSGRVVHVQDGDSLTILDVEKRQHKIRIAGIDAPEKAQPFGNRARQNLVSMAHGQEALADCPKTDRYGRKVCKVWIQPSDCPACDKTLDIGYAQISGGMAWWYRAYAKEQAVEDRGRYESEENEARLRKRGIWVDDAVIPPWEWRTQSRKNNKHR